MTTRTRVASIMGLALALASSCVGEIGDGRPSGEPLPGVGSEATDDTPTWTSGDDTGECNHEALLLPRSYGAKAKTLLTGLPLSDGELLALESEPDGLGELIDGWLTTPEADAVLERFLMTAFQQTGGTNESLFYLMATQNSPVGRFTNPLSPRADEMLNANFSESLARTMTQLVKDGRPFTDFVTTNKFMMTTAMMSFLAYTDDEVIDDDGGHHVRTTASHFNKIRLVRDKSSAPPPNQALNSNSPNFATFWHPRLAELDPSCGVQASQTIDTTQFVSGEWRITGSRTPSYWVFSAVTLGRMQRVGRHDNPCFTIAANVEPLLQRADFNDWRMVTVRQPNNDEVPSLFYRANGLRASNELVLHTPRVGFLTTPGFFSTWPNNEDNSARVSINQALIVALGSSFAGQTVSDFNPDNIDAEHAEPGSECYGCHQTLDPMRDYFRASYTNFYSEQLDPERMDLEGNFVFGEVQDSGNGIGALVNTLAQHPMLPYAWAHKLCYYANARPCAEGEELDRVVSDFVESNLDFRVLLRELFSSPLITGSACVAGGNGGTATTIARRSTFCNQMSHRLNITDLCGLRTHPQNATALQNAVRSAVASVPDDSFSRAEVAPVVIAETGLFARANREAACSILAQGAFNQVLSGMTLDGALDALVEGIMALPPSDPRNEAAREILADHVVEVAFGGNSVQTALQSAMALACMSPGSAGVGF